MSQTVTALRDRDGVVHYMSATCQRAVEGLADGTLTPAEEVPGGSADDNTGDGDDTQPAERRPRDRKRNTRGTVDVDGAGVAEPELGR